MSRFLTIINPYFWQTLAEDLWQRLRDFWRSRPVVATIAAVCVGLVVFKLLTGFVGILLQERVVPKTTIAGVLQVDGAPVSEGVIQFLPKSGESPTITIIRDGRFEAKNVIVGPCQVVCFATREKPKKKNDAKNKIPVKEKTPGHDGQSFPERISVIPEAYRKGIELTIEPGQKELALDWNSR